ncbi:MAG: radical SAM protein, partial [Mailhella sp.]|nr:radical SAM protein [Mailhella sp.]
MALLSPAAEPYLEEMAQRARELTLRFFGRAVNIFSPLYISDICTNHCRYCGFNASNHQKRRHLSVEEAAAEAFALADAGIGHVLLLTGDARHIASPQYIADVAACIKP